MKEGYCILYLYDPNYKIADNNKGKVAIEVCDEETAWYKAMQHKEGFARILSNSENNNIWLKEFMNGEPIFLEEISHILT